MDLCDNPTAIPVRRHGFIDHTRDDGPRMIWQFWFADGSSYATLNPRVGLKETERMMKAGVFNAPQAYAASVRNSDPVGGGPPLVA